MCIYIYIYIERERSIIYIYIYIHMYTHNHIYIYIYHYMYKHAEGKTTVSANLRKTSTASAQTNAKLLARETLYFCDLPPRLQGRKARSARALKLFGSCCPVVLCPCSELLKTWHSPKRHPPCAKLGCLLLDHLKHLELP